MRFRMTLLVCFFSLIGFAQDRSEYKKEHFISGADTLNYRILFPKNFDKEKQYPLLLVLHGAGERGNNNESQLVHGGDLFLKDSVREQFPAIVIFPQAPKDDYWARVEVNRDVKPFEFDFKNKEESSKSLTLVMNLMDEMVNEKFVNNDQVYVGGLSMGGMGTFEIIYKKPEMFAAAFAICGGANTEIAQEYPDNFNIWLFHGEKDDIVLPKYSKSMAREINHYGGNAKLSLYPNDNHNSWDSAFSEPYLLPWLFSFSKNSSK
ncbi:prolyl oligopeptidase family serine peptidase [uncultured Christiangramia sp.]|uniref:carboxylesterase family protein n=1 Tax=Christiangramia sp. 3-2217-3z TaxID=3417564 RepID=UPI00261BEA2F|nr:prolyl oligopeptidase family serine peptidase [uncultured Christiangramia sp.]